MKKYKLFFPKNNCVKELNLCEQLGIAPYEFLLIKDLLVRECLKEGFLTKDSATNSVKLGKNFVNIQNFNVFE